MRTIRDTALTAAVLTTVAAPATDAAAQLEPSSMTAACVGGAIGCQQVDFFLAFTTPPAPPDEITFDRFTISLSSPGWTFSAFQGGEAEDAYGPNFFFGIGSGATLTGEFDPFFEAVADQVTPTVRLRAGFDGHGSDATALAGGYEVTMGGAPVAEGTFPTSTPGTPVPEPVSLWLLATGGLALLVVGRRRWTARGQPRTGRDPAR